MKTKVLAALAATMAVGATCAFAANPFQGNRNITRYEAAEMVAKAMAHMDKASVEQRALINKLADEYADELNNLGVRVSALENRVGNVKLTGDARVRYIHQDSDDQGKGEVKNDNSWSYRVRVRANAQVNDRTKVVYGVSTNNVNFADNSTASDSKDNNIFTDRAFVDYNFGGNNWDLKVGRDEYDMGGGRAYGFLYGDTFDGAQLKYTNDKFAATAGYGKFKEGVMGGDNGASAATKTGYGELEGFFGGGRAAGSAVGVYYNDFSGNKSFNFDDAWGAYGSLNLGKWNALANYEKYNSENSKADDPEVWVGKITYNKANFATPKSWGAWVEYLNADNGFGDKTHAFIGSTQSWRNGNLLNNVKSWGVGADYTFAKNAQFQVMQSFASEAKEGNNDPGEETRAQFVFVF